MNVFEKFHHSRVANYNTNHTFLCLILKKIDSHKVIDFRPISIVTGLYKFLTKVLANKLKEVLGTTISKTQSAFISGRQILDGVLVANELVDYRFK